MRTLYGYPQPSGAKMVSVFPHAGPDSYDPVVETSPNEFPVTGGDVCEAVEAGLQNFDCVQGGLTDDGAYRVEVIYLTNSDDANAAPSGTVCLRWVVVATGAEVASMVDLSDRIVRLSAIGPN